LFIFINLSAHGIAEYAVLICASVGPLGPSTPAFVNVCVVNGYKLVSGIGAGGGAIGGGTKGKGTAVGGAIGEGTKGKGTAVGGAIGGGTKGKGTAVGGAIGGGIKGKGTGAMV